MKNHDAIDMLKASPVYAMTLGSKELFHSNFWFWLIEQDPIFVKVFFTDVDEKAVLHVKRESLYRDLTITMNDYKCYVIENKIKSIPSNQQLKMYQDKTPNMIKGLLTGIKETLDITDKQTWSFKSYVDIAKLIQKHASLSNEETISKNRTFILEYCQVLLWISEALSFQLSYTAGKLMYDYGRLYEIRIDDVFKKFKSEDFIHYFRLNYGSLKALTPKGYERHIWTSFSNKQAIIDFRFLIEDKVGIGIQIQGNQFRIIAERSIANKSEEVFNEFCSYKWFDTTFDRGVKREIFGKPTLMKPTHGKSYNKYQTSRYSFVYQYFSLSQEDTNYSTLSKLVLEYMQKAQNIVVEYNVK